jgi:predicted DNA-binding transcriptional regulator AlpA
MVIARIAPYAALWPFCHATCVDNNAHLSPDDRLLRAEELAELLGIGVKQFWRNEAAGRIGPARVKFWGSRSVRFSHRETMAWLPERTPAGELLPRDQWRERWQAIRTAEETRCRQALRTRAELKEDGRAS